MEKALTGISTEVAADRIKTVSEVLESYRHGYAVNRRARSVAWIGEHVGKGWNQTYTH
jgi:hypothetical protein